MVEVLIALLIVGIVTITMVSFINDPDQRYRVPMARGDLARIAQAIQLAEQQRQQRVTHLSEPSGAVTSMLAPYLMDLPRQDPWGNRFAATDSTGRTFISSASGDPYVVDIGMGRIICAGPDGVINTQIGQGPADNENDIVYEYRRQPFVSCTMKNLIHLLSADGASNQMVTTSPILNLTFSAAGNYFAGVQNNTLVVGSMDDTNAALQLVGAAQGFSGSVSVDTFPVFYPNGGSVLFISGNDLQRYDIGTRTVTHLTTGGFLGAGDSQSGSRLRYSNGKISIYNFLDSNQIVHSLTISPDGKLAFSAASEGTSGIYLVSASGGDLKMVKQSPTPNQYVPVTWLGTDVLVYMTNPVSATPKYFFRMNQDGSQDLALHQKAIQSGISLPLPSNDGALISLFTSETEGAVLNTDGSGFVEELGNGDHTFRPFAFSAGINTNVTPIWSKNSQILYFVANDGSLLQLGVNKNKSGYYVAQTLLYNGTGARGLKPVAIDLNADESLFAVVSSSPGGVFMIPTLGPDGARTQILGGTVQTGESSLARWLDRL